MNGTEGIDREQAQDEIFPEIDKAATLKQAEARIRGKYRQLFSSPMGREVLIDILNTNNYAIQVSDDPQQIAYHNVCVAILMKCGISPQDAVKSVVYGLPGVK